jgi:hypothetical protein
MVVDFLWGRETGFDGIYLTFITFKHKISGL